MNWLDKHFESFIVNVIGIIIFLLAIHFVCNTVAISWDLLHSENRMLSKFAENKFIYFNRLKSAVRGKILIAAASLF